MCFAVVRFNYIMYSLRFDEDCEDDITEPIASCTSVSPQVRYILKANPFQHLLLVKKFTVLLTQVNGKLSEHVDAVSLVDKITGI